MSELKEFLDGSKIVFTFDTREELINLGKLFMENGISYIFKSELMPDYILQNPERVIANRPDGNWWCRLRTEDDHVLIRIKDFL